MTDTPLRLSILMHGRNDGYMGNFSWRMTTCLNKLAHAIYMLGAEQEIEIVFCDWGSRDPLIEELDLADITKTLLRVVIVPPATAAKYDADSRYSAVHAMNTISRRARGKYLLFSDTDNYVPFDTMRTLYESLKMESIAGYSYERTFFWGSRYHIPKDYHSANPSSEVLDRYIEDHTQDIEHRIVDLANFLGGAGAFLVKKSIWDGCRGLDERFIYWGWSDIELHYRIISRYAISDMDLYGMRFYHLNHYSTTRPEGINESPHKMNPQIMPTSYAPNGENWGLGNELLRVISWSN
ncbi:MAG: hypothetical protein EPN22_00525 [Nitrospirae bacterium]|nr:MAG: hypothetical protein EPN22_00525 [Nitrospirota bacterium]